MADTDTDPTTPSSGASRPAPHALHSRGIASAPGTHRETAVVEGGWDDLRQYAEALRTGCPPPDSGAYNSLLASTSALVAGASLVRKAGGGAELTVTQTIVDGVWFCSMATTAVSKSILTWRQDAEDEGDRPDLSAIAMWQALEESDPTSYGAYQYSDADGETQTLSGATLELAKMIREKGVEYYMVHVPTVTVNMVVGAAISDLGQNLDRIFTGAQLWSYCSGLGDQAGYDNLATVSGLRAKWLQTDDRLTPNADGTQTRTLVWLGADDWNEDLYANYGDE